MVTGEGAAENPVWMNLKILGHKNSPGKLRFWGEILPVVSGQQIPKLRSFVGFRVYCAIPDINKTPPANPSKDSYWDVRLEVTNTRPIKTGHVYIQPTYLYVYIYIYIGVIYIIHLHPKSVPAGHAFATRIGGDSPRPVATR